MDSDLALLHQYAEDQSADAFAEIAHRHAGLVYGACLRILGNEHDAEDVSQECLLELARKAGTVQTSLSGWLHALATRRSRDAIRRAATRRRYEREAQRTRGNETGLTWAELAPHIDAAIEKLPEDMRLPIVMHYLAGRTQEEVAQRLQLSQPTVSRRIADGISQLRAHLKPAGVVVPAALLGGMLAENATVAAPASVLAAGGKIAVAGVSAVPAVASLLSPKIIALVCAAVVTIAAVTLSITGATQPPDPPQQPKQAQAGAAPEAVPAGVGAIKFVGVRPDVSDDLYDQNGEKVGKIILRTDPNRVAWSDREIRRDFIFKIPDKLTPERFTAYSIIPPYGWNEDFCADRHFLINASGQRLFVIPKPLDKDRETVDIRLSYVPPAPGPQKPRIVFTGPFEFGDGIKEDNGNAAVMSIHRDFNDQQRQTILLRVRIDAGFWVHDPVLIYDTAGKRHFPTLGSRSCGEERGGNVEMRISELALPQIAKVTIGEEVETVTFKDIVVAYPERPRRTYAAYLDEMAQRLGLENADPRQLRNRFLQPEEGLKVIDIVRGENDMTYAFKAVARSEIAGCTAEERQRVLQTAQQWVDSPDPLVRGWGAHLGLMCGSRQFVDAALEAIRTGKRGGVRASSGLEKCDSLEDADFQKIKALVMEPRWERDAIKQSFWGDDFLRRLMATLSERDGPGTTRALAGLARDPRPWLWWPATRALADRGKLDDVKLKRDELTLRVSLAAPEADFAAGHTADIAEVQPFFTPLFARMSPEHSFELAQRICTSYNAPAATEAIISFLRKAGDEPPPERIVRYLVTQLNAMNDVDIAGIGKHFDEYVGASMYSFETQPAVCDRRQGIRDAIAWYETGVDPGAAEVTCTQPKSGDLRVVFFDLDDPENSLIGVWIMPEDTEAWPRTFRVRREDGTLGCYEIIPRHAYRENEEGYSFRLNLWHEGITGSAIGAVAIEDLPQKVRHHFDLKNWEIWLEPLDAKYSVLSGTELFADWSRGILGVEHAEDTIPEQPEFDYFDAALEEALANKKHYPTVTGEGGRVLYDVEAEMKKSLPGHVLAYKAAFREDVRIPGWYSRSSIRPDIKDYSDYVGRYAIEQDQTLEITTDAQGRFLVTYQRHVIPALAVNKVLVFATGKVWDSWTPSHRSPLHLLAIARTGGEYQLYRAENIQGDKADSIWLSEPIAYPVRKLDE